MHILQSRRLPALGFILFSHAVAAQQPALSPDYRLDFRSAFDGYRAFADETVAPWRDTNDLVGRIGGWRVYAREGADASPPAAPSDRKPPSTELAPSDRKSPSTEPLPSDRKPASTQPMPRATDPHAGHGAKK